VVRPGGGRRHPPSACGWRRQTHLRSARARSSVRPAAAEAARTSTGSVEIVDEAKRRLHDWDEHELRDALERLDRERFAAAIPAAHHQRSLVIRINETDQVAEND